MPNSVKLKALLPWPIVTFSGGRLNVVSPGAVPPGISAGLGISSVAIRLPLPFEGGDGSTTDGGGVYGGAAGAGGTAGGAGGGAFSAFDWARAGAAASATSANVARTVFPGPDVTLSFLF